MGRHDGRPESPIMKKGKKYWKKQHHAAVNQARKAIGIASDAIAIMKDNSVTIATLQARVEVLQAPTVDPYTVDYRQ